MKTTSPHNPVQELRRSEYERIARATLTSRYGAAIEVTDEMVACLADALQEQAAGR